MERKEKVKGAGGGTSKLLSLVDIQEQYGRHIIDSFAATLNGINKVCDIGCGYGNDLEIIKKYFKHANYYGIDYFTQNKDLLLEKEISLKVCDLEKDELDFEDSSVDLFVANQVFEHLKEIFWVTHQMSKKLKVGGYLIIGVPNIAALHNRIWLCCVCLLKRVTCKAGIKFPEVTYGHFNLSPTSPFFRKADSMSVTPSG